MPSLHVVPVAVRRLLARRPWIYWLVVLVIAVLAAGAVRQRVADIDEARRGWGETRSVLVAREDARPGQAIDAEVRDVPAAIVPLAALPGAAEAKGTVKCEGIDILERKLGRFDLPGEIKFGDGYPIDPLQLSGKPERQPTP